MIWAFLIFGSICLAVFAAWLLRRPTNGTATVLARLSALETKFALLEKEIGTQYVDRYANLAQELNDIQKWRAERMQDEQAVQQREAIRDASA